MGLRLTVTCGVIYVFPPLPEGSHRVGMSEGGSSEDSIVCV